MGAYTLTLHGIGKHHNGTPGDADAVAKEIVAHLERNGHKIHSAVLSTATGHENLHVPRLLEPPQRGGR